MGAKLVHRGLCGVVPVALALFAAGPARADGAFEFGAGLMGAVGGNFLDKPDDKTFTLPDGQPARTNVPYPGFGGVTTGVGLMLDFRLIKIVGLEVDVVRMSNRGKGDITLNGDTRNLTIGQPAWHLPVLLKGTLPLPLLAPQAFVGPEFVFPGDAEASSDPNTLPFATRAHVDSYMMWTFGVGLEIKLPLPVVDLRIPFQLRGSINPKITEKLQDRVAYGTNGNIVTSADYNSAWRYQALATLGAALYF